VARQVRCEESLIASFEDGTPNRLAPVYQRGFAARYADLLGLESRQKQRLLEGMLSEAPALRPVFDKPPPVQATDRWLRVSTYVVASLLVGTLAWQLTHEAVRLSQSDQASLGTDTQPQPAETEPPRAHVNASIASLENLGDYSPRRAAAAGSQGWAAMGRARTAVETPLQDGEHLLQLATSADSWVEIRDRDGNLLEQDLVRGGSSRSYRGYGPYRITLGRTSAVELQLDGEPVVLAPGTRDDVTQMTLDPQAAVIPEPPASGG
jgi:cytoskeleton protein RodZ